jgi:ABC-type bacteriocin/lantibiotic exporter with double-glycine peptidase domain
MTNTLATPRREPEPIPRLLQLVQPDRRDIGLVIVFSVAVGILSLAVPIAAQMLFNYVAFGALLQPLFVLGIMLLIVLALAAVMRAIILLVVELLQRRVLVRIVGQLGDRLPRVRAAALDRGAGGQEMVNRFFDVLTIQKVGAMLLLDGVAAVLQTTIGLIIVAFYHPFLLAFCMALLGAGLFVVFVLGRSAVRTAIDESTAKYEVAAALEEIAADPIAFKQADAHRLAARRADEKAMNYVLARRAHFRVVFRQFIGALFVQVVAASSLLTIGGYLVIREQLTLGQLVAAELIVALALASFTKIAQKLGAVYDMLAAVHKLSNLLDVPLERSDGEAHPVDTGPASIRLRDVSFSYPGGADVLAGANLDIAAGERVAVIGPHGSGKSTLVDLLFASREPTSGQIELDGIDLRELRVDSIRQHVAVVERIEIVGGTIEENVRFGRPGRTSADVRDALSRVGLLDTLRALPAGLATTLIPTGRPLTRGQRQRLMLARALAGRPRLLVVNDILDAMDRETRDKVLRVLTDPDLRCTVIMLGHNEGIGAFAQRVFRTTPEGGLVENGTGTTAAEAPETESNEVYQ